MCHLPEALCTWFSVKSDDNRNSRFLKLQIFLQLHSLEVCSKCLSYHLHLRPFFSFLTWRGWNVKGYDTTQMLLILLAWNWIFNKKKFRSIHLMTDDRCFNTKDSPCEDGRFKKPEDATGQKVERKGLGSFSILYTNSKDLSSSIFHCHLPASTGVDTPEYVTIFLTNLSATIKKTFWKQINISLYDWTQKNCLYNVCNQKVLGHHWRPYGKTKLP